MVLERMHIFFGPFPLTYKTLANRKTLTYLADIMSSVTQRKPFHMIKDKEFEPKDNTFLLKVMKLNPRDRPTAKQLLEILGSPNYDLSTTAVNGYGFGEEGNSPYTVHSHYSPISH